MFQILLSAFVAMAVAAPKPSGLYVPAEDYDSDGDGDGEGALLAGYSFLDANGHLQTVQYVGNGFRLSNTFPASVSKPTTSTTTTTTTTEAPTTTTTELPIQQQLQIGFENRPSHALFSLSPNTAFSGYPIRNDGYLAHSGYPVAPSNFYGYSHPYTYSVPSTYEAPATSSYVAPAPLTYTTSTYASAAPLTAQYAAYAPSLPLSRTAVPSLTLALPTLQSQYHAQSELGHYEYGYRGLLSAKHEAAAGDGSVAGAYSYLDADGIVQSVRYLSDDVNGFRVAGTNLPTPPPPSPPPTSGSRSKGATGTGGFMVPVSVTETPEVKAARRAHEQAHREALARNMAD